ncbi:hypothetical protein P389DRAFT_194136 [Cystobasidium minutum MCA 4210]|uniref:uncharacterized protein n=1 Tax=Cystobasidium minutum MCA 4210 TaxID=1397322 RepID=UPI0034CF1C12|eukprot:jgi/Rhomi1/194136/gm1.2350_g
MDRTDDPVALAADEPLRRIFRIVLTYQSSLLAVMLYDWLLSLSKEFKYIWKQKFTLVTGLYVILRYFEIVRASTTTYLANNLIPNEKYPPWARFQVYSAMAYSSAVYLLFIIRASAVYGNSILVKVILGTLASVILIIQGFASTEFGTIPWATGHGPCFAGKTPRSNNILVIFWLGPFIFDTVTTAVLFIRIVIIRRRGGADSSMLKLLIRDGILYFVVISAVNLLNVGFYLGAAEDIHSINSGAAYNVTSIACSQLILSLRHLAYKQNNASTGSRRPVSVAPSHVGSGVVKARSQPALNFSAEEKGMSAYRESGFEAHIALDTFENIQRKAKDKAMDSQSLGGNYVVQTPPVQGVFVVTETKTVVDQRDSQEVDVKSEAYVV